MKHDREILKLALPSIISNVTVPLLGLADVTIMGHIGDARYIGAIAVGSMIFNVVYWLFGFLRMATSGLTAQAYGAWQQAGRNGLHTGPDGAPPTHPHRLLRQGLAVALLIGALIVALQWPLRRVAFWLMGPTPDVAALVTPYYNTCVWGAPAMLGLYVLMGWFVGMQNTRVPMFVAIGQNVLNIVASVSFVFLLGMGIEGVALGTLVAQWAGFGAILFFARGAFAGDERRGVGGLWRELGALWQEQRHASPGRRPAFALYRDIFLRTLCLVSVNLYFTAAGAKQGALVLAVNTLLMQLYLLFSYFLDGFANAGEALAGRYYGAGDRRSLREVVVSLFRWSVLMAVLFTAVYALGGDVFLRLLTSDDSVVSEARRYYGWALLVPASGMAAFVWDGIFIGLTRTRGMLWACLVASVAFFALWMGLNGLLANHALWLALVAYLATRGAVQTWLFCHPREVQPELSSGSA